MRLAFARLILLLMLTGPLRAQTPPGQPYIRLDKSAFASGEAVFFWTGVQKTGNTPILKEYWDTCRLTIMRPDGTTKMIRLGWPMDGPVGEGWMGGCGLGEQAQPGRYVLVFEFAGQKTAPTPLIVEDVPDLKKIAADFVFGPPVTTARGSDRAVTLSVKNNTNQTIRFPHRDGMNGLVSVSVATLDGRRFYDGFYPADKLLDPDEPKLPDHGFDEFTWKNARDLPTIALKPGETYTQRLPLSDFVSRCEQDAAHGAGLTIPKGAYSVTFSTTLPTLIGEEGGPDAAVSPVHIPVSATAVCAIDP